MAGSDPRVPPKGQEAPQAKRAPKKPRAIEGDNFLEGKILIALPGMPDPRFEKTLIYMCAHSGEGAMGIIINKPVEGLTFPDLMKKLEVEVTGNTPRMPVLYGGPMDTGRGFVLHSGDYESQDATLPVAEDVSLTTTVEILRAMSEGRGPRNAIFALGYAGWSPGQIENELRGNGWIHCDADAGLLFGPECDSKWATALRKLGIDVSSLSAHAGHA
jgi:putative transcriptional regulator